MKSTSQPSKCPECAYVRSERAAIHEFDGKASREWAEYMAGFERCLEHSKEFFDSEPAQD
jgi:hypothetical protein